jgi:hypothetical protein
MQTSINHTKRIGHLMLMPPTRFRFHPPPLSFTHQVRWLVIEAALYKPGAHGDVGGSNGGGMAGGVLAGTERLLFAPEDLGTRLKVWWAKDKVFYSGTVTDWSP